MSEPTRHLRLVESFVPAALGAETPAPNVSGPVAVLHEWRAAQIARSKAMHPSTVARAAAAPALRPLG